MAGRIITTRQQEIIAHGLTGLCMVGDLHQHKWTKEQRESIQAAYSAVGVKMPFAFQNVETPPPRPSLWQRLQAKVHRIGSVAA